MRSRRLRREEIEDSFRPLLPLLREVIADARNATAPEVVAAAHPAITRVPHLRRLAGAARWMIAADRLVLAEWPEGYGVESDESDHNQGKYAFRFPLGVFTIKREPHHDEEEGKYLQECLADMREFAPGEAPAREPDVTAYLSVPPSGSAKVIVTHKSLRKPMTVLLDELEAPKRPVPTHPRASGPRRRGVRSARAKESLPQGGSGPSAS
jgi:hypothetical protein